MITVSKLNELAKEIHADNVKAGWWNNKVTGLPDIPGRERAQIIALCHSELSEAWEAFKDKSFDDKLPHHLGVRVEIADTAIRLFDILGAEGNEIVDRMEDIAFVNETPEEDLLDLHLSLSKALEGYRKNNMAVVIKNLELALFECFLFAEAEDFDLLAIIEEKREFNRHRADHKIENRVKEGGKTF